jgi:hypothetical protein
MFTRIASLSELPSEFIGDDVQPRGVKMWACRTDGGKYVYALYAENTTGPYALWENNAKRARTPGGVNRPRWRRLSAWSCYADALEAALAAMKANLWGGRPRRFRIEYVHPKLAKKEQK